MIVVGFDTVLREASQSSDVAYLALSEDFGGREEEAGRVQLEALDRPTVRRLQEHLTHSDFAPGYDASDVPNGVLDFDDEADPEETADEDYSHIWDGHALIRAACLVLRQLAVDNTLDLETRWRIRCYGGTPRRVHWRLRFRVQPGVDDEQPDGLTPTVPDLVGLAPTPHEPTVVGPPPDAERYGDVDTQFHQLGGHLQVIGDHWDRFGANMAKYYDHMLEQQRVVGERMDQRYATFLQQTEAQIGRLLEAAVDSHNQVLKVLKQREAEARARAKDQSELETARDQRKLVSELAKDGLGKLSHIGELVLMSEMGVDPALAPLAKLISDNPGLAERLKNPDLHEVLKDEEIAQQVGDVLDSLAEAYKLQREAEARAAAEAEAQARAAAEAADQPGAGSAPPPPDAGAAGAEPPPTPEPGPGAGPS